MTESILDIILVLEKVKTKKGKREMTLEEMKRIKQERGFSMAQLSEYSGVPLGTLQKIFSGATEHSRYATRQALEKALTKDEVTYSFSTGKTGMVEEAQPNYEVTQEKKQGKVGLALYDGQLLIDLDEIAGLIKEYPEGGKD